MAIELYDNQLEVIDKLKSGSILCGGVGSGKSLTSLGYYYTKDGGGSLKINGFGEFEPMPHPKPLYIITTARKRDTFEWDSECTHFLLSTNPDISVGPAVTIDSWNNIKKYENVKDSFFIFDEQRLVGYGTWVKAFLKIAKNNKWLLLSATPGDTWTDYLPVFIANGFYKNKTEFNREHVVFSHYSKYPKIERYIGEMKLRKLRARVKVDMEFDRLTISHHEDVIIDYDKDLFDLVMKKRWNIYESKPIKDVTELFILMRKVVNSDPRRVEATEKIVREKKKVIIFYNFNYELELLREMSEIVGYPTAEWNGHNHQTIPETDEWIYLVQYQAGAEGWNCIQTNIVIFYSLNYSHKIVAQAAGRIDRLNTPYKHLYYYHLMTKAPIDLAIRRALNRKRNFHERSFIDS